MQSATTDVAPVPPPWRTLPNNVVWRPTGAATWRTGQNTRLDFDSDPFALLYKTTSFIKPEVRKYCIAVRGGPNQGHRWQVQKIWSNVDVWFSRCASEQTKQTDRHTDTHTQRRCMLAILRTIDVKKRSNKNLKNVKKRKNVTKMKNVKNVFTSMLRTLTQGTK